MSAAPDRQPMETLFAYNRQLWLRVWAATQSAALAVAAVVTVYEAGGPRAFFSSRAAAPAIAALAVIVVYHAVGIRAHRWILSRAWAVMVFVPLGWVVILGSVRFVNAAGLLIFGAVIQGFIFLPFIAAIAILGLVVATVVGTMIRQGARLPGNALISGSLSVVAMGVMVGTVMLYIHRVNRDSAIRARLLRQLDDAQRDLADRARESGVQEERQRLARDIHDTLAQGFTSVIKHLEAIELSVAASDRATEADARATLNAAMPHLAHARDVSRASLGEIRRLVWALRPPQLAEATLGAAIERIVLQWGEANAISATCTVATIPPLQPDADVIFLRATQEALSNVARHANARNVAVAMQCVDGLVLLSIDDDGCGFVESDADRGTFGIAGMRERVRRFGGHVLIETNIDAGTSVTVAMPYAEIAGPQS